VDHHEWWGTRDMAAFLSVAAAIEFQKKHNWERVRDACHALAAHAQAHICEMTGLRPLHPVADVNRSDPGQGWFRQMCSAPLPQDADLTALKSRLYDEFRIEVPVIDWSGNKLIRLSVQGYNTEDDLSRLQHALSQILHDG
jgi:isopenicillin-N epimerase